MPCGCKKRFKKMENSESPVVRAAAEVIRPAHELAMRVMDKVTGQEEPGDASQPQNEHG